MAMAPPDELLDDLPLPGTPGADPLLDDPTLDPMMLEGSPDEALSLPSVQTIENALVNYLQEGQNRSIGMFQSRKREWARFKLMKEERGSYDDPSDPLVRLGLHIPTLAKLVDVMKAGLLSEVLPDPSEMNFFELQDERGYFDEYARRMQFMLRKKYQTQKPLAAGDFASVTDMLADDYLALGTCVSIITHEILEGEADGDGITQGPTTQYIDPMNWWPWDWDVDNAAQTQHNIFAPLDIYALKGGGYVNTERVIAEETPTEDSRRDPDAQFYRLDMYWDGQQYSRTNLFHRYIHFGMFPGEDLRKAPGLADVDDQTLMAALAPVYGFDPSKGMTARWWHLEWIGKCLTACRPYPLDLPQGEGPLIVKDMIHKNGRLVGLGMYDRGAWDERLLNFYYRAQVHITKFAMNPAWWYYTGSIDPAWLQQQGSQYPQLVPGRPVPIMGQPGPATAKPMEAFPYNIEAIPTAREQSGMHEASMRELTGATAAVEGDSRSKTATQDSNNLQQSLKLVNYWADRFISMMKRNVAGAYCVMTQVLRLERDGYVEYITADLDEEGMVMLDIRPEHALSLKYIKIVMTGRSAPGNRMNQAQAFDNWAKTWLPTGVVDPLEASKTHAEMLGITGARRLLISPDMWGLVREQQMRTLAFGPQGAQEMTSSKEKQQQQQVGSMGAPTAGPPMPQQTQARGPMGAPMMAGN